MRRRRWGKDRWTLVMLLLLAWTLRLPPILNNRLHPDEALYGTWGLLIGRGQDPWLVTVPVYKPPLLPYLTAAAQALFGTFEFSVRSPGLAAGLLMVPLVAALARSLYRDRWGAVIAATSMALSPFAITFSATAFTDPLMVMLGMGACAAAVRGRPGWAGVLTGLAFAAKQAGLVWLPLVVPILILISNPRSSISCLLPFVLTTLLTISLVFAWDGIRVRQGAVSFWHTGILGYGGLRLIWPQELWARLRGWAQLARHLFSPPIVNGLLLLGLPTLVWNATMGRRCTQKAFIDLLLISFLLVYFLLHWLWAFGLWDRYLLPLLPIMAVLLGRLFSLAVSYASRILRHLPSATRYAPSICYLSLIVLLLLLAWNAAHNHYPIAGNYSAYDGINEAAAFLSDLPGGAVVYQHWLGWQYGYYLFDAFVYLAYWPTPVWLAQDVQVFGAREPRYITFPSWESSARVERMLADVGFGLEPVLTTTRRDGTPSFTVYHIQPRTANNEQ